MAKQTDLFGEDHDISKPSADEPTEAWVRGWNDCMSNYLPQDNPYPVDSYEHNEWQGGYDAAERD